MSRKFINFELQGLDIGQVWSAIASHAIQPYDRFPATPACNVLYAGTPSCQLGRVIFGYF